jgi:cytochrome c553
MITKRVFNLAALALAVVGLACSSSASKPKDGGGDAAEAGRDAGDAAGDTADASSLTAAQARGKYLVDHVIACADCHTPMLPSGMPDLTRYLAGNPDFVVLPNGEKLGSRNLTNDPTGLKNRSDQEIKEMFMDGKRPAQAGTEALNPIMPYYVFHNMTDADADAIVAYLRIVPGVANEIPRRGAAFDLPAPANYLDPSTIPAAPADFPEKVSADRGRYLSAQSGLCIECHTPHNMAGPDVLNMAKVFQGGEDFSALFASTLMIRPVSKNLTSDVATGLGSWTVAEIVSALKEGKAKDGSGICPPMPSGPFGAYGKLEDQDATDIANYLKSLAPATSMIPDMCTFPPMPPPDGGADAGEAGAAPDGGAPETADADEDGG